MRKGGGVGREQGRGRKGRGMRSGAEEWKGRDEFHTSGGIRRISEVSVSTDRILCASVSIRAIRKDKKT
jgi:hypothetical protein